MKNGPRIRGEGEDMFGGSFGRNIDIISRELDASVLRQNVIANNIANADVPEFKRSDVTFESQLKRALDSEAVAAASSGFPQYLTDPRHIPFNATMDYRTVNPRIVLDYLTTAKNNGNNVDIEQEGMNMTTNYLLYATLAQAISSEFQRVNIVLR
jgi:flagellar basal-body rod protein FlgB